MLSYNPDELSEINQTLNKSLAMQRETLVRVLGLEKRVVKLEKPNTDRSRKKKLKYMVSGDLEGKKHAEIGKTINAKINSQGDFKKFIQPDDIKPETLDEEESVIDKMRSLANALQFSFNNAIAKIEKKFKNQFFMKGGGEVPGKKRRGRPKKLKTLEEVQADIDARNPTYISPITGGRLPGLGPKKLKVDPNKLIPEKTDDDKNKLMDFLTSVLQPSLTSIEENLSKILGNFEQQIESDKDA